MHLAEYKDSESMVSRSNLLRNLTGYDTFFPCYEKVLVKIEKINASRRLSEDRSSKFIGHIVHGIFKELEKISDNKRLEKNKDHDAIDDFDDLCDPDFDWCDDRDWCWFEHRWDDTFDRDGDRCICDDDLCCDCEPDRGSSCCYNWCFDMCDRVNWDFRIERFCDDPWHWCDPLCMKFDHCCRSRCSRW